jgi:cytochrome c oxidase cbb3-type subunit 2
MRERDAVRAGEAPSASWWAATAAVAATYVYFLIFAEFAFLELARAVAPAPERLRLLMAGLGGGGVAGALGAARWFRPERGRAGLVWAARACALAAGGALAARTFWGLLGAGIGVGLALGALTVFLAASLRSAAGAGRLGRCIGVGTGLAYGCCNLPVLFQASAAVQTAVAAGVALAASWAPRAMRFGAAESGTDRQVPAVDARDYTRGGVGCWVAILLALVWMDSAAFYIIQHSTALRAATWGGMAALYANAVVHLAAAAGAGWLLDRGARVALIAGATGALAAACLMLAGALPAFVPAAWAYTAGVSLYSTVLIEYPARSGRAGLAALVFAVAGWVGSALGIGMAQDLERVPVGFVAVAGAVIAAALVGRSRRVGVAAGLLVVVAAGGTSRSDAAEEDARVLAGREVYIAEGCMHCHSQYVRPHVAQDVERWGPATGLTDALRAAPPLLGNRRQGPDLANVGNRRSFEWNRLHLIAPRAVSPGTRMPSYAYLFEGDGGRGEALLTYLASLGAETLAARGAQIAAWRPRAGAGGEPAEARRVFARLCTPCHGPEGRGDGPLAAQLSLRPPDWSAVAWRHVPAGVEPELALSRIIKFGLPGLPMAGHEYLSDQEVVGLARFVQTLHKGSGPR